MSTPDLAYIAFAIMTLALITCLIYISHIRHQNLELYSIAVEQDELLDAYDMLSTRTDHDEYIRELLVQLEAASECANEYRTALTRIDNMLQTDPIQFLFTTEEIHHG